MNHNQPPFGSRKKTDKETIELGFEFLPKFDSNGLIPCITVDISSKEVLMFAWMNQQALKKTLSTGMATYYSRSRQKLWVKGENSGLVQWVEQVLVDCDQDVIQLRVQVKGEGACHNGYRSCFYRAVNKESQSKLEYVIDNRSFDPKKTYEDN